MTEQAVEQDDIEEVKEESKAAAVTGEGERRRHLTDQSNEHDVSIGNRTAEELVGDILASDPLDDDDDDDLDVMLSNSIAKPDAGQVDGTTAS